MVFLNPLHSRTLRARTHHESEGRGSSMCVHTHTTTKIFAGFQPETAWKAIHQDLARFWHLCQRQDLRNEKERVRHSFRSTKISKFPIFIAIQYPTSKLWVTKFRRSFEVHLSWLVSRLAIATPAPAPCTCPRLCTLHLRTCAWWQIIASTWCQWQWQHSDCYYDVWQRLALDSQVNQRRAVCRAV
jgi:hypothetical protein